MRKGFVALVMAALMICYILPVSAEPDFEPEPPAVSSVPTAAESAVAGSDLQTLPPEETAETESPAPSADEPPQAEDPSPEPEVSAMQSEEARQAVIRARIAGDGALTVSEEDGRSVDFADGGSLSVDQGSTIHVEATPERGSEYVMARYNGRRVDSDSRPGRARSFSFVATESGDLEVTFAPQYEVKMSLVGSASVSAETDGTLQSLSDGASVRVRDGAAIAFRITPVKGSEFDGAEFNGKPIAAAKEGAAWVFSLPVRESGTLTVRCTTACTVSTILNNAELLYDNEGEWQVVKEGDNVLSLPGGQTAQFAVRPAAGRELTTLLVNGSAVDRRRVAGLYRFSIREVRGPVIITAVASAQTQAVQGVDPKTGVHYLLPGSSDMDESNITEDSWISVVELKEGPAYDQALADSRPYGVLLSAYDLSLHNGSGIYEPSVPVSVSFPVPPAFEGGHLKVLRASGASIAEIPYRTEEIQGAPCVTVTVDGFSLYMLVDAPDEVTSIGGQLSDSSGLDDGNMALFVMILGLICLALILFWRKQRTAH